MTPTTTLGYDTTTHRATNLTPAMFADPTRTPGTVRTDGGVYFASTFPNPLPSA